MADMKAIEVSGLNYRYSDGTVALKNLTFSIDEGEKVGIIGPNGAGKSTLFLHLNGLLPERPTREPSVKVFGIPVAAPRLADVRSMVGLMFQDPDDQLFCPTVGEDVGFGPSQMGLDEGGVRSRVEDSLRQVGLTGYQKRSPHRLSGGEKRRVCLAGLLACRSRVLVLDEPTGGLDPRGRRELKALLNTLPVTQLVATHDLEFLIGLCNRVVVMDAGEIVAEGPLRDVMSDQTLMLEHGLERPHALLHPHPHTN
jgi:energy-coupling factor transporter ATP-binding protein EcfA2